MANLKNSIIQMWYSPFSVATKPGNLWLCKQKKLTSNGMTIYQINRSDHNSFPCQYIFANGISTDWDLSWSSQDLQIKLLNRCQLVREKETHRRWVADNRGVDLWLANGRRNGIGVNWWASESAVSKNVKGKKLHLNV